MTSSVFFSSFCRLSLERAERLFAEVDRAAVQLEQLAESRRDRLRQSARMRALREETTQVWIATNAVTSCPWAQISEPWKNVMHRGVTETRRNPVLD